MYLSVTDQENKLLLTFFNPLTTDLVGENKYYQHNTHFLITEYITHVHIKQFYTKH